MNIEEKLKETCGEVWLRAMGADQQAAKEAIAKCQAVLDSGEDVRLFPWQASTEEIMFADARKSLEAIVLDDWFKRYTDAELETMCGLLRRCPGGADTCVTILPGFLVAVSEIVARYNDTHDEKIRLADPDIG